MRGFSFSLKNPLRNAPDTQGITSGNLPSNITCSPVRDLCIIGFAYRAAVARTHLGVRLAAFLESQQGISAAQHSAGSHSDGRRWATQSGTDQHHLVRLRDQTISSTPKPYPWITSFRVRATWPLATDQVET